MKRLKTSLHGSKTLVFFRNVGRMHWATYVIFQDLKIIEEFDSMGPTPSGIILKGLYRWLFLENKRLGVHLDSSEWRLYPTRPSTSRQRNGYDYGVFSILFALHTGLCLKMNNISQAQIPTICCQMLLHFLKKAQANDNNEVLPVGPDRQEANANNPLDDGNYVGETVDAAYDVDNDEEDDASQANDNINASDVDAVNNNEDDGGRDQENAGEDNNAEDGGQDNDPADNDGDAGGGGDQEDDDLGDNTDDSNDGEENEEEEVDSEEDDENEEEEVDLEEDDENVDALYQEGKDMEQMAESQPTFGGLPGALPPSQVFSHLVADMSRPALMVLTRPAAALAIQDDELTLPVTSPVVASLSPFLTEDVSRSIEKDLMEAELMHAQSHPTLSDALIQADLPK
jgi:hypothetical protein